jgi:hypothetical protein
MGSIIIVFLARDRLTINHFLLWNIVIKNAVKKEKQNGENIE